MTSKLEDLLKNMPTKDKVLAELERIKAIKWFKPLELDKKVKKAAEKHIADSLKLFGIKKKYKIAYRELNNAEDWKGAFEEALKSTLEPVWQAAQAKAEITPQDAAFEKALESARKAAQQAGAEKEIATEAALEAARNPAQDIICILHGIKNPFAPFVSLLEMGFYVVGPTRSEFILYYVPKK